MEYSFESRTKAKLGTGQASSPSFAKATARAQQIVSQEIRYELCYNLSMIDQNIKYTGCCDPFDSEPWENKEITWRNKLFVKDHVRSFLHIPLNFGKKVVKNMELIEKAIFVLNGRTDSRTSGRTNP